MLASGGDSTVGVALEPLASGTGKIKVLISRRNESLAVQQVDSMVTDRIAGMKIEDQVNQMVAQSIDKMTVLPQLTVAGNISAASYEAPLSPATGYAFGTTTVVAELPPEVLTAGGSVDLYKLATYNLSGLQALAGKVDAQEVRLTSLEDRVTALESGAVGMSTSSPSMSFSTTTLASALDGMTSVLHIGKLISDSFYAAYSFFGHLTAANVTVGSSAAPSGVTLYDSVTKQPYCFSIANGAPTTTPGICVESTENLNPFATSTPPTIATSTTTYNLQPTAPSSPITITSTTPDTAVPADTATATPLETAPLTGQASSSPTTDTTATTGAASSTISIIDTTATVTDTAATAPPPATDTASPSTTTTDTTTIVPVTVDATATTTP
jgi:hypothetical protein